MLTGRRKINPAATTWSIDSDITGDTIPNSGTLSNTNKPSFCARGEGFYNSGATMGSDGVHNGQIAW